MKLVKLIDVIGGGTPSRKVEEYWNGDIPWISVKDFKSNKISKAIEMITKKGLESSSAKLIPKGNIIIPTRMALGKVAINEIDVAINQDLKALVIKDLNVLNLEYLFYFLLSKADYLESSGKGATVKGITINTIADLDIKLPSMNNQMEIVYALGQAQSFINKRQSQITALDELTQSVFLEMFGDPVTNNKMWKTIKLGASGTLKRGMSKHRPRNAPELLGGQYPLIQTGDVANSGLFIKEYSNTYSELGLQQSKIWEKGTLCITIAANIAKTGILTFDSCFPDSVVSYKPNDYMSTIYVHYWFGFLQKIIEASAPESAQKNINLKILNDIDIPIPPYELQREFEDIVLNIERQREQFTEGSGNLEKLFNSTMHKAFKGELFQEQS